MMLSVRSGGPIAVGELLGAGKQGEIYAIHSRPDMVFKKYKPSAFADDPTLESRLAVMTAYPPAQRREPASGHVTLTWPTDIVMDGGRFAGFLMPAVDMDTTVDLHQVTNPTERPRATGRTAWVGGFTWQYLLRTAVNLAHATDALHQGGVVVGDFNDSNVRVTHDARVTLLDCDSMQVTDPATGQRFFCTVGRGEFTPPELLNTDWKSTDRHPSSDLFALAVHVYQLLLEGEHPFRGIWAGTGEKPHEPQLSRLGIWAHQKDGPLSPRPAAIPIATLLPPVIVALFRRAFEDGATNPTSRPTALEWRQALSALEASVTTCTVSAAHYYPNTCHRCPWCRHAIVADQRPLPPLTSPAPTAPPSTPRTSPAISRTTLASFVTANAAPRQPAPVRTAPRQAALPPQIAPRPKRRRHRRAIIITVLSLLVVAGATVGGLRLFDKPSLQIWGVATVAVSPNGEFIASADYDDYPGKIYIWSTATKRLTATLTGQSIQDGVTDLAISPDSKTIVALSSFSPITIWDTTSGQVIATISGPRINSPSCLALSPDGKMLALCGEADSSTIDDNVYLVNIQHKSISATLHTTSGNSCQSGAAEAAFSPDSKVLAVAALPCNGTHDVQLWDISTQHVIKTLPIGYPIVYSHDGRILVDGSGLVNLQQATGEPESIRELPNNAAVSLAAFGPDDKILATADYPSGSFTLWKLAINQETATLTDPGSRGISGIAYTPDGKTLVTADGNGNIYLWNVTSRRVVATLAAPSS